MLYNGLLLGVLPVEGLHDKLHLRGDLLEHVLDVGRGFAIHLHRVAPSHTGGTGGVSCSGNFHIKADSNIPNISITPWAAGLADQSATGGDEKRNTIELASQLLADNAVHPHNCRHLKKVGLRNLKTFKGGFQPTTTVQIIDGCHTLQVDQDLKDGLNQNIDEAGFNFHSEALFCRSSV